MPQPDAKSPPQPVGGPPVSDIVMMDAAALGEAIRSRAVSCVEVMRAYLDHIDRLNPVVNAIVSRRDADVLLEEARERDEDLARGLHRGPLHGFPQAIKDLAATKGIRTTQGSPLLSDVVPESDAIFVARMKASGAIIVGKTNTPEFGLGSQTYNPVFGTTRNAYDPERTAGGSSGGAAVALALRMLPVADGSDHAGSLRNPAGWNNVLGLRPSFGRVPGEPDEVFIPHLGVVGPMARNAADLALLLSVQAGPDPRTPLAIEADPAVFRTSLESDPAGRRIAWLRDLGGHLPFEPGVLDLCERALKSFEGMGCAVEEVLPDYPPEAIWRNWLTLRAWLIASKLGPFHADPAKRAGLKPEALFEVENGLRLTGYDVHRASVARTEWYHTVRRLLETYDVLAPPTAQVFPFEAGQPWPREVAGRTMDTYHRWMEVVIPATMSGCPTIAVPAGFGEAGLPMGLQLIGRNHGELELLRIAHAYEAATGWVGKVPPRLLRAA